jgi:putative transposase
MGRTYTVNLVHCVFSTKQRQSLMVAPEKLWNYLRGIGRNIRVNVVAVGGTADHVHLLLSVPSTGTVAKIMRDLKANSSRHLNEQRTGFAWQDGYGAISVSPSQVERVVN